MITLYVLLTLSVVKLASLTGALYFTANGLKVLRKLTDHSEPPTSTQDVRVFATQPAVSAGTQVMPQ